MIAYVGNMGEGQGLHRIVPAVAKSLGAQFEFWLYGDGGAVGKLREALEREEITNVKLTAPVARQELLDIYRRSSADIERPPLFSPRRLRDRQHSRISTGSLRCGDSPKD